MNNNFVLMISLKITKGYKVKSIFKPLIAREIKKAFYKEFDEFMNTHSFLSLANLNILYGALLRLGFLDAKIKRSAYYIVKEVLRNVEKSFVSDYVKVMKYLVKNDALDEETKSKLLQAVFD